MKTWIQKLVIFLAIILPMQTLFATFVLNVLKLPVWVLFWKEAVEVIIMVLCLVDIFKGYKTYGSTFSSIKKFLESKSLLIFAPVFLASFSTVLVTLSSLLNNQSFNIYLIGFRFELFWIWFFCIVSAWLFIQPKDILLEFYKKINLAVLLGFILVSVITIFILLFGQSRVLSTFGFVDGINSVSEVTPVICHFNDLRSDQCNLPGTFGNTNHFSAYLILVFPFLIYSIYSTELHSKKLIIITLLFGWIVFFVLSFARFAWVSLILSIVTLVAYKFIDRIKISSKYRILDYLRNFIFLLLTLTLSFFSIIFLSKQFLRINDNKLYELPGLVVKPSSTSGHSKSLLAGTDILKANHSVILTGYGLGSSGPAAKADYYNIYSQELITRNTQIADRYNLPLKRLTIPESWYIQLILNGGIFYFIIYVSIIMSPAIYLMGRSKFLDLIKNPVLTSILISFLSIIFGNLVLHLFENSTLTIYFSILFIFGYAYSKTRLE